MVASQQSYDFTAVKHAPGKLCVDLGTFVTSVICVGLRYPLTNFLLTSPRKSQPEFWLLASRRVFAVPEAPLLS